MENQIITLDQIRRSNDVKILIKKANEQMNALGYTEHGFRHAGIVAETARSIPESLGFEPRLAELAAIAGYLHDVGNAINRNIHCETGAVMAFSLLTRMGMPTEEVATIIAAIGNHEEELGCPVSPVGAALILADKADVHHSRVQNPNPLAFDIHDRVNHAVQHSCLRVDKQGKSINLELATDSQAASVMEYFEIFLTRMLMCRRAADFFGHKFRLIINGADL
ncbi:MAG: HD domain-containing protein [Armatimonadetes bacterium]|nr:HD domain-containing protein [Armatimonadota bacterium]